MSAPMVLRKSMFIRSLHRQNSTSRLLALDRILTNNRAMITTDERETLEYLQRTPSSSIAFRQTPGKDPGVVFLPGFMSNMTGGKAVALEGYCKRRGHAFVRFDYQGLGESIGELEKGAQVFEEWKSDALSVLDELTVGPQILVGSSMGGAIMLLLALERPERIHSLLGIATAGSFDQQLTYADSRGKQPESASYSHCEDPTSMYTLPRDFIGKHHARCLKQDPMPVKVPVRLIHGMRDETVPYRVSVELATRLESKNVDVILRKEGGHRMSEPDDIRLLVETIEELMKL